MSSTIKPNGVVGGRLNAMADRGGCMTADHRGFPPSKVFLPLRERGLVTLVRTGARKCRYNVWHLTEKGWAAIARTPPTPAA